MTISEIKCETSNEKEEKIISESENKKNSLDRLTVIYFTALCTDDDRVFILIFTCICYICMKKKNEKVSRFILKGDHLDLVNICIGSISRRKTAARYFLFPWEASIDSSFPSLVFI